MSANSKKRGIDEVYAGSTCEEEPLKKKMRVEVDQTHENTVTRVDEGDSIRLVDYSREADEDGDGDEKNVQREFDGVLYQCEIKTDDWFEPLMKYVERVSQSADDEATKDAISLFLFVVTHPLLDHEYVEISVEEEKDEDDFDTDDMYLRTTPGEQYVPEFFHTLSVRDVVGSAGARRSNFKFRLRSHSAVALTAEFDTPGRDRSAYVVTFTDKLKRKRRQRQVEKWRLSLTIEMGHYYEFFAADDQGNPQRGKVTFYGSVWWDKKYKWVGLEMINPRHANVPSAEAGHANARLAPETDLKRECSLEELRV